MSKFRLLSSVWCGVPVGSAERKEPHASSGLARKALATFLSGLLLFQPALLQAQQVTPDAGAPAANRPDIGAAPNGIPLIDIATPNSAGLSHNKYGDFNVGTPGLILNNYNAEIGTSKLGGVTPGNSNLRNSGPASVILNEVTSGRRSALEGPVEVFGGRADVIIANPNGITCDGCGFINTPRATLTTGNPDIGADGRLNGFTVRDGNVTFGPKGANFATGDGAVDIFDVISRTVKIDGPVYGKDLRLTAGQSKFDYATGEATALDATSGTPEYAIDGSALGAMQAGRIKMVVTEKGAGVRMRADMAANVGELSLSSDGKISIGNASGNRGVTIASKRSVTAGRLTSKKAVSVKAGKDVSLASVGAEEDILIDGGTGLVDVSGALSGNGALSVLADGNLTLSEAATAGPMSLSSAAGSIGITGTAQSDAALSVTAASGAITAGTLLSQGDVALLAGLDLGLSGGVLAGGNLQVSTGGDIRYGSLEANEAILLSSLAGVISLDKRTAAGGDITISERHVDLSGNRSGIATSGTLHVNTGSANLTGSQLTFGGIDLVASGTADLTGTRLNTVTSSSAASTHSSGDIAIAAGSLTTTAATNLLAAHDLTLSLTQLTNAGQLAAGNDLTINVSGNLTNTATGLIYAGNDAALFIGGVLANDQGAIVAGRDLAIAGSAGGARNAAIVNRSGLITADRNMTITTTNLRNEKIVAPTVTSQLISSTTVAAYDSLKGRLCPTCSPSNGIQYNGTIYITEDTNHHVYRDVLEDRVLSYGSPTALIKAGKILSINTVDLTNAYSAIEAGTGMTLTGTGTLTNLGLQLQRTVSLRCDATAGCEYYPAFIAQEWMERHTGETGGNGDGYLVTTRELNPFGTRDPSKDLFPGSTVESVTAMGGVPATIKSGGAIGISGFAAVNNTALAGTIADHVAVAAPALSSDPTALLAGMTAGGALFTLGGVAAPQSGGFGGTIPGQSFLFETRAAFLDVSKFYGSSYFLDRIGYQPDHQILFLGDAYFENQYVEQQLRQVTGSGFAGDDTVSQIKQLLDNGADYLGTHQHGLGEPLTAEEIAGLTQSVVVYEWQVVDGKSVLAPVLHLAPGDKERIASAGAVIAGKDVTIDAGVLATSGMVASNGNLAVSGSSIAATGGSFKAGGNASLTADNVSIVNGSVSTGGNLSIKGDDGILVAGSKVAVGGNLALNSNGDINISATGKTTTRTKHDRRSTTTKVETTVTGSQITAGGSIAAEAGGNLNVIGSTVAADGTLGLKAAGDVTIAEAVETTTTDYSYKKKGGLFGGGKKTTSHAETQTAVGSSVSGGKGVTITSGGDTTVSASTVSAGDDINKAADLSINAGGNVVIASGKDTDEFTSDSSSHGLLSSSKSHDHRYDETTVGSDISATGNVKLQAGGEAVVSGSSVSAGGDLALSGSTVTVMGAQEEHETDKQKKKSGIGVGSGGGFISIYGSHDATTSNSSVDNVGSQLSAANGDIKLNATKGDLNVIGSSISATDGNVSGTAAGNINILPGHESDTSSKDDKRSGFGLQVSAGGSGASIGIGAGRFTDKTTQSADTNAVSTIDAGGNITLSAGNTFNDQAGQIAAGGAVTIIGDKGVNILSGNDVTNFDEVATNLFAGVTLGVSSSMISAGQSVQNLASKVGNVSDGYSAANAVFAGMQAYDALSGLKDGLAAGNLASISLTAGFTYSKTETELSSSTPVLPTISGNSVSIIATNGDFTGRGLQIAATADDEYADDPMNGNVLISANTIDMAGAQATSEASSRSKSAGASIGVSVGVGLGGATGITPTGSVSAGQSKSSSASTTQVMSIVSASNNITFNSKGDTKLENTVFSADTIDGKVGGNLDIMSTPSTGASASSSTSLGFSFTGPTIGRSDGSPLLTGENAGKALGGITLGGIQPGFGSGKGSTNWIDTPSGLYSDGATNVYVGGNTNLAAAGIVSSSGQVDLNTGTLTYSDFEGSKEYKNVEVEANIDLYGGKDANGKSQNNSSAQGKYQLDDVRQSVKSTVNGDITIRDKDQQAALESSGATKSADEINKDPGQQSVITKDKHIDLEPYVSVQSLEGVVTVIEKAATYIDRLVENGSLDKSSATEAKAIIARLMEVDPDTLKVCTGGDQGSIWDWIVTPAYAGSGCVIRFKGQFGSTNLTEAEYNAIRDSIVHAAEGEIKHSLSIIQSLDALVANGGSLSSTQAQVLARAQSNLQQQMAQYVLCSDSIDDLRNSGIVPNTAEFNAYFKTAEAYRVGGDALGDQILALQKSTQDQLAALRKSNPSQYQGLMYLAYGGSSSTLDAAFLLKGLSQQTGMSPQQHAQIIQQAAASFAQVLFSSDITAINGVGGGNLGSIRAAMALATQNLSVQDRVTLLTTLNTYANLHADAIGDSVGRARIGTAFLIAAGSLVAATPEIAACFANTLCRIEAVNAILDTGFGEAIGGSSFSVTVASAGGAVIVREGDQIVSIIDDVTHTVLRQGDAGFVDAVKAATRTADGIVDVTGHSLIAFENFGGHTIAQHIGKTDADLLARLASNPNLKNASSFPDIETASAAIANTVADAANQAKISSWMAGGGQGTLEISSPSSSIVGAVVQRGATQSVSTDVTTVVLTKDPLSKKGYTILTSFPDL
ncbi:hypothetical protein GCM10010520_57390 [Rhizobium viscosum]|uniref:Filamentous hemagglutinin n=1 Tax=Rhizobium viscosum TaxID=1673 RepID=A0ABR9IVP6_RHIVS|nr:hemagglutinin repeat-containing protein [Rhizobium viscosum]MBE1507285.1 filamentous hemagglutinin [Rhizobium viscosum]